MRPTLADPATRSALAAELRRMRQRRDEAKAVIAEHGYDSTYELAVSKKWYNIYRIDGLIACLNILHPHQRATACGPIT